MQTTPNWTDPLTIATALGLLALLVMQVWLIGRNPTLSPGRKTLRAALNGLLWLVLLGYVLKIGWLVERPATHALLIGDDVPAAYARTVQDSLGIRERLTAQMFKSPYDSITLVGQNFSTETLTQLSQSVVRWVPYEQPGRVRELRWKAVVRQGEMQRVTGQIRSNSKQLLRIQYGSQTLDSLMLTQGNNSFTLQFPVFSRGRTQTELVLDRQPLDTIRFYGRPTAPLLVQFVLNNPDFESKTLAEWLGKQGHSVQVSTTLATNVRSRVDINDSQKGPNRKPDVIITDPANTADALVRNAIADGKAVLFINLINPVTDVTAINRSLGTRWQIRKISGQETVSAGNNMTAHPYQFTGRPNQFAVPGYPVAMQQTAGRVAVSLLNETFPLALSGDSVAYSRIWSAIVARLQPVEKNNVLVNAPLFSGLPASIYINNPTVNTSTLRVGTDTTHLIQSPLNRQSATGTILTKQTNWLTIQDSLAVYVEPTTRNNPAAARQIVSQYMLAHSKYQFASTGFTHRTDEAMPGWVWLTLFLLCLTALWVEPKVA